MNKLIITIALWLTSSLVWSSASILIVGDSLSAGYGIKVEQSWPALLQEHFKQANEPYKVHNASISGQTTSEGVRQIDQLLQLTAPKVVVLELGANDGLRGLSITEMESNLETMIKKANGAKAKVVLLGIRVLNNYGRRYGAMFTETFERLAQKYSLEFVPFMLEPLEKVLTPENRSEYIQADGLHPTAKAQPLILNHLLPSIRSAL